MRHAKPYRKLSRQRSHYRALMRNLAVALFFHERVQTTVIKAKEARRFVDKLVGLAKTGSLHDRRRAISLLGNIKKADDGSNVIQKLFSDIGPRMVKRPGGYTRIVKIGNRPGDAAPIAYFELVDAKPIGTKKVETDEEKAPAKAEKAEKKVKKPAASKAKKAKAAA